MKFKATPTNGRHNAPYRVVNTQNTEYDKALKEAAAIAENNNHLYDLGWYIELERLYI